MQLFAFVDYLFRNNKLCSYSLLICIASIFSHHVIPSMCVYGFIVVVVVVVVVIVVVVRLEQSHSFIDSFDNHPTASGTASCRRRRPPGNAVSGHSSCGLVALSAGASR